MLDCIITSPKETFIHKNIQSVTLPALSGQMQIFPNHAESFILLKKGKIVLKKENDENINIENTQKAECYINKNIVTIVF